jgi:hypothetical protein
MGFDEMKVIRWVLFVLLAVFLAWRMVAVNLSQQVLRDGEPAAATGALEWAHGNPQARYLMAQDLAESDSELAERVLVQAIIDFPVDGGMLVSLGLLLEEKGAIDRAMRAMEYADHLAPARVPVQAAIALFWGRRQDKRRYLTHLVRVMALRRENITKLYPVILSLVDDPASAGMVRKVLSKALAGQKSTWWSGFFGHASTRAKHLDTLRLLYNIRRQSRVPPKAWERNLLIARLEKAGKWVEAYFLWLNSLDNKQLKRLSYLFNGDFESPLSNDGFGWHVPVHKGAEVMVASTHGVGGRAALRVGFSNFRQHRELLTQQLLLPSGSYRLEGRIRSDGLRTGEGIVWRLQCLSQGRLQLWQSDPFKGVGRWRTFSGRFDVPTENCEAQRLYLALADSGDGQRALVGVLWFDDLAISNLE